MVNQTQSIRISKAGVTLSLLLVLVYLKIHLTIPGLGIPYFWAHALAWLYLIRTNRAKMTLGFTALAAFALLFQYLLTAASYTNPSKQDSQYFIYWLLNFGTFLGSIAVLQDCNPGTINRICRFFLYGMLLIAFSEVYLGARPLIDEIRSLYTSTSSLYNFVDRDIQQYGAVRATALTSEPSSAGNYFGFLVILLIATSQRMKIAFIEALVLCIAATYLFRTPTLTFYIAFAGIILVFGKSNSKRTILGNGLACVTLAGAIVVPYLLYLNVLPGLASYTGGFTSTGSFYIRQIAPINTFLGMISESPLMGFGFQYSEHSRDINSVVLASDYGGFYTTSQLSDMQAGQFSTNAFWEFFSTNGILGSIVLLAIYRKALRAMNVPHHLFILLGSSTLLLAHGGLILPFTWTPVVALAYFAWRRGKANSSTHFDAVSHGELSATQDSGLGAHNSLAGQAGPALTTKVLNFTSGTGKRQDNRWR